MTFKPTPSGAKLVRRLKKHGIEFVYPPECHGIARDQQAIRLNILEGLDNPTWWLHDQLGHAHIYYTHKSNNQRVVVEAVINSDVTVTELLAQTTKWELTESFRSIFIQTGVPEPLNRYWVSWWSTGKRKYHCKRAPFQWWISGQTENSQEETIYSYCAMIDAPSEEALQISINHFYPDNEMRFVTPEEPDGKPGNRFPDFMHETRYGGYYLVEDYAH